MTIARDIETSVLVVTDDHPPDLARFARGLLEQSVSPTTYEVVLVDVVGGVDYRGAFAQAVKDRPGTSPRFQVIHAPGVGRACGYNAALAAASPGSRLILFFADDFIAPAGLVESHEDFHRESTAESAVGIGAALLSEKDRKSPFASWLEASGQLYGVPFFEGMTEVPPHFFYIGNASIKRTFLERVGSFDEGFRHHAWDDYELGLRLSEAGMHSTFVPAATAEHAHSISLAERCRAMRQAGEAARVFESRHELPSAWQNAVRKPPWRHLLKASRDGLAFQFTRSDRARHRYYKSRLRGSFCEGYRAGAIHG
jgi:GT2 family glycosyltransferase